MCGRFTLSSPPEALARQFDLDSVPELAPRYNIAPSQPLATVRWSEGASKRVFELRRWGLVPSWAEDAAIGNRLINARAETASQRPSFRDALRKRRCLIPADGFYEWGGAPRARQAYHIAFEGRALFAMAGLWERWQGPEGTPVSSCTIVTTAANTAVRGVHDRMPAILGPADYALWLDPSKRDPDELAPLLRPWDATELALTPVGSRVNDTRCDDPGLVERFEEQPSFL